MPTKHETLSPDDETSVVFGADFGRVAVLNVSGAEPIYFRADGVAATVAGDDTYAVPAGARRVVEIETDGPTEVSLISAAAADVEIEAL